mmetsp:Transcript_11664/g.17498  ORF Transcript_11664/g.17498 Transcript_11664/m.17498 type:complete len:117 (-) Transcript_11664:112-462(-)
MFAELGLVGKNDAAAALEFLFFFIRFGNDRLFVLCTAGENGDSEERWRAYSDPNICILGLCGGRSGDNVNFELFPAESGESKGRDTLVDASMGITPGSMWRGLGATMLYGSLKFST